MSTFLQIFRCGGVVTVRYSLTPRIQNHAGGDKYMTNDFDISSLPTLMDNIERYRRDGAATIISAWYGHRDCQAHDS